ncbi:MAG: protein-L-isoaspartate O-methyltransferase [Actinomycetota bacterium]|nr:protein-L-isoaspartate O-methyltransferase [Actinomycetota bacterium]
MTAFADSRAVDAAMAATPRADFLPAGQRSLAGENRPLPIGGGQTNSQPQTVRNMLIALQVSAGQRVLDVGAGSGWSTVLLARLVGKHGSVIGVERVAELIAWGASNVAAAGLPWARLVAADPNILGRPADAPYDRIMVSAEAKAVPAQLMRQLAADGMMVIPVAGHLLRARPGQPAQDLGRYAFVPLVCGG